MAVGGDGETAGKTIVRTAGKDLIHRWIDVTEKRKIRENE